MSTNPSARPTIVAPEPPVIGQCAYCGCSDPREPFVTCDYHPGPRVRLWCSDERACNARQDTEAAWAERARAARQVAS